MRGVVQVPLPQRTRPKPPSPQAPCHPAEAHSGRRKGLGRESPLVEMPSSLSIVTALLAAVSKMAPTTACEIQNNALQAGRVPDGCDPSPAPAPTSAEHSHEPPDRVTPEPTLPPRSLTNFTATSLNSRLNFRLSIENSDSVETPYLGVHETGSRPVHETRQQKLCEADAKETRGTSRSYSVLSCKITASG
jgi:hypothetical protein